MSSAEAGASAGVRPLAWETGFLGVNVGALEIGGAASGEDLAARLGEDEARAFDLLVITCVGDSAGLRPILERAGAVLVDTKLDYEAAVQTSPAAPEGVELVAAAVNEADSASLHSLALESGRYSRFRLDPRIGETRWAELYRLWIQNSLAGELADAVFAWRRAGAITGFVTVKRQNSSQARIGLIGVAAAERGTGVGTRLIAAARGWSAAQELTKLRVATQQANRAACQFYESRGFSLAARTDIYHLWAIR